MNEKFRLEWHWLNLDDIFTVRSNDYLRLLDMARNFSAASGAFGICGKMSYLHSRKIVSAGI